MNDAGKILLTPKGKYNSLAEYEFLDCVTYDGNAYVARKTTIGNLPTDGEYWCLLIENAEITPTFTIAQNLKELKSGERYQITFGKIAKAVKDYILHKVLKATNTGLGHVKVTNSAAVTDSTGLALAATEKNAALEGTLANLISKINSNFNKLQVLNFGNVLDVYGINRDIVFNNMTELNVLLPINIHTICSMNTEATAQQLVNAVPIKYGVLEIIKGYNNRFCTFILYGSNIAETYIYTSRAGDTNEGLHKWRRIMWEYVT